MTTAVEQLAPASREIINEPFPRSFWPVYEEDEIKAVAEVLRSGRVNSLQHGDRCRAFEAAFAARVGVPHAIAMANGTVTLEVVLKALGIGPGDEVVVSPRSFIASASCVVSVGATPIFADVDPETQLITSETVSAVLSPRTKAIIPVHLGGWPCDMEGLMALARSHGLFVIEDCAQAHGAMIGERAVGSFGDAASFSFCTDKIMSTGGEGGLLLMSDSELHARVWSLKDHGKRLEPPQSAGIEFRWLHDGFGTNLRMTEMQAAIGLAQLGKLDGWLCAREANARALSAALAGLPALRLPRPGPGIHHSWYKYTAFIRPHLLHRGESRDSILQRARDEGIACFVGTCPEIYREAAFGRAGLGPRERLPVARELGETSLLLQVDPTLSPDDMIRIGTRLAIIIDEATV